MIPPVIELSSSSNEEDFFADIAWDVEFTKRLFGDLNCNLLRPPSDGKVIIISDFDEEGEACEDAAADVETVLSAAGKSLTPACSTTDADDDPGKMQDDNSDDLAPGQGTSKSSGGGDEAIAP
jgi:hypothetical protein